MTANLPATPCFLADETRLRRNAALIADTARRSGAKIIMAFKANALWRTFGLLREEGCPGFTASSPNELRLGAEELGGEAHVYSPAVTDADIDLYLARATHITFNSVEQFRRYAPRALAAGVSPGLRVNPGLSQVATDAYNPALPGSRLGVRPEALQGDGLPEGVEGLHVHALCESSAAETAALLEAFEAKCGRWIDSLKWVNLGGGHLMTRRGYDRELLIDILAAFRRRHPGVELILEPGSAWTWQTGELLVMVVDVVEDCGVKTAIIDASFACHMPDTLEMPYRPEIAEASADGEYEYRLGGNSCLSGDWCGPWRFNRPLKAGDRLTLLDMNHYTTVKTTMFNGVAHPALALRRADGTVETLRRFGYDDYKSRMD